MDLAAQYEPCLVIVGRSLSQKTAQGERQQILRIDGRSSNLLNHANYASMDGIVGTPQFGLPLTADYGRRIEFGARLSF